MKVIQFTRNESATIGTTSVEALKANDHRKAIYIHNTGATTLTICKGIVPAVAGAGIVIASGSAFFETDSDNFNAWKGAIQIVSSAAGGTIGLSETTEM